MLAAGVGTSPRALLEAAPPIVSATVHDLLLRKSDPTWRFALAANPDNRGLILELRAADGRVGLGSAGEVRHLGHDLATMRAVVGAVAAHIAAPADAGEALDELDRIGGPARAIVQMALLDLVARSRDLPAHELLGTLRRDRVALTRILSLKAPDRMAAVAAQHVAEGYRHLKIKLDNADGDADYARVAAIRSAVGPDVALTVDANQSYRPDDALRLCDRLAPLDLLLFEQPVPADDIDGLAFLTARSPVPIEADEAADSLDRLREIVDRRAAHGVSVKLPKLGGIDRARTAIDYCRAGGVPVRIGAHVGSRLLNAAALHLAAVVDELAEPAELAEFARLEGDPAQGLDIVDGTLVLPGGPGLGVHLSEPDHRAEGSSL